MQFLSDVSLEAFNTLALPARAANFCTVHTLPELEQARRHAQARDWPVTVLGGGSNVVLVGDVSGLVVRMAITGIETVEEDGDVLVRAGAGENWHSLVAHCLENDWYGLENLALIPGSVGAAPIQNIGAYGVELAERFESLEALVLDTGECVTLGPEDCRFGYRDSVFKQGSLPPVIITSVTLRLLRQPRLCLDYPELAGVLAERGPGSVSPRTVFDAVCALRRQKLPDPSLRPNAGSFFKNPVIDSDQARTMARRFPDMPRYAIPDGRVKVPAAWLIDRCGWKGRRLGAVGVHDRQALVLVNFGGGVGKELLALSAQIADDVRRCFGIELELEPTVLGAAAHTGPESE